jgi:hypothetical protein
MMELIAAVFIVVVAFAIGKQYGIEVEKKRRAKDDARWRARQKGEQIDETQRDWWLKH